MMPSMAERSAIQQGVANIPSYNGKNMLARDFIQDINGESFLPVNCKKQYLKPVLARLKDITRDIINEKTFKRINYSYT